MNPLKAIADYLRSVNSELRKVSWPSRRSTINYSALVIGISLVTAISFAALDFGFTKLAEVAATARTNTAQTDATSTVPTTTPQPVIDFSEVTPITPSSTQ